MSNKAKGITAAFLAAIFWGYGFIASDIALNYLDPIQTVGLRFIGAALVSYLLFFNIINTTSRQEFIATLPLGVVLFLAFTSQTAGLQYTTVANNSFFTSLSVVFTPYLVWMIHREKPERRTFVASILALIGVLILSFSGVSLSLNLGDLLSILCAFLFALQVVLVSKTVHIHFIKTTFIQSLIAGVLGLVFSFFIEGPIPIEQLTQPPAFLSLSYIILFSTLLAYLLQTYSSQLIKPSLISVIVSTETIFATIFAFFFLDQAISLRTLLAFIFILTAIFLMSSDREEDQTAGLE